MLQDGRTLSAIADTTVSDIDANWHIFLSKAQCKWGSRIDTFQVVQLSKHDREVKNYIKSNYIHLPSHSQQGEKVKEKIRHLPVKIKSQPGKYRS